jgi:hypothetical protein
MTALDSTTTKKNKLRCACLAFWPLLAAFLQYMAAPGFIVPFLNHPIAQKVLLAAFAWLVVGFFMMLRAKKPWQFAVLTFIFPLPVLFLPMLGPAAITIITALGEMQARP